MHTLVGLLAVLVRQQALADDVGDGHTGIQGGIRILEDILHLAAQGTDLRIGQARKVDAVIEQGLVLLELGIGGVLRAHGVDAGVDLCNLGTGGLDELVMLGDLLSQLVKLALAAVIASLAGIELGELEGLLVIVELDGGALLDGLVQIAAAVMALGEDLHDRAEVLGGDKAADDIHDVQIGVVRSLLRSREIVVHVQALLLIGSIIDLLHLVALLFERGQLMQAVGQMADGLFDILGGQLITGRAIVHRLAVGLTVELQQRASERGLAAAGLADEADRFAFVDIQADAVVRLDVQALLFADREILPQVRDLEKNIISFHAGPPSAGRSSEPAASR